MKRALALILVLATALAVALMLHVRNLRTGKRGPAGGTGVIEGVDVDITSRLSTRITKVNAREGDVVKHGDLLVELDCTEAQATLDQTESQWASARATFEAAQASAKSAAQSASAAAGTIDAAKSQRDVLEAEESSARADLERTERLTREGVLSASALEDARTKHVVLLSQIAAQHANERVTRDQAGALWTSGSAAKLQAIAAENNIRAELAAVARAEAAVRECKLTAPRDGMIAARNFEPGEAVQPGAVILTLTDLGEARTRFYLPNDDLGFAAPGKAVRVVADAYPGQSFAGTIFYVSARAEFTPRNVQTREDRERLVYAVAVRIPNVDLRLRSGMPVEVSIEGSGR